MAKRAVLIGINEYEDPAVADLRGCANDVELMGGMLEQRFGFDSVERLLSAPHTTRDGIFDALDRLIDATSDGDVAVLYYSGHGSQVPDSDRDEKDFYDETLVPSDSGRGNLPVRDIVDDELHSYLAALASRAERAYFIFDSCHSGSVDRDILLAPDRDAIPAPRAVVPADTAPEGARRLRPEGRDAEGPESASGIVRKARYVLIAGCLDAQTSKETDFEGKRNGALTYHLTRALLADGDITLRAAFEQAAVGVKGSVVQQDPVLEGPEELLAAAPF
jgi:hypothetical protein